VILGEIQGFFVRFGHIENNVLKMSTKWGYPWTFEKDNFVYVQNSVRNA